ncbi:MAG: GspE/PulE family protein [Verrucomicrobiota bacterium]
MPLGKIQLQIVSKLVEMGRITPEQRAALASRPDDLSGDSLDKLLQEEYKVSAFQCLVAKARALNLSPFNVVHYRVTPQTFERIPQEFCQENLVLPVGQVGEMLLVAFANPFEVTLPTKIQEITGKSVVRLLAREKDIRDKFTKGQDKASGFADVVTAIGVEYGEAPADGELKEDDVTEESGPIIQLANRIIEDAYFSGTSDIHIEPQEKEVIVRNRIDGVCHEKLRLPKKVGPALIARLKIMCNLDIAERRLPQDGRIIFKQYTKKNIDLDLRVSTAPLNHGEGVVMRILDKQKTTLPLPALGFSEENLAKYRECIRQPYGMILHCGPTGSGKSMTLYSALNEVNTPDIVIRTAEDPIEYTLPGLNQMQMHRQIGLTFAAALRSFLRQDPDIILVGEIRDKETAGIAVEAALTGHLLISTLHTNDAPTTIARLTEMGVESFMVSSSLLCVCAQRLMRRVCKQCRQQIEPQGREKDILEKGIGWSGPIFKANPKGCPKCGGSGYKGRVGIHELMVTNEELVAAINKEAEAAELKKIAIRGGMKTLHQDSLLKVKDGLSTLEEAIATVPPDM